MNSLVINIKQLAEKTAYEKGFEIIAVELDTQLNPMKIQLQVHPATGGDVSIEDCALLSDPIEDAFNESKLLMHPFVLEISSPGINELLESDRDFETFKGFPVEISFIDKTNTEIKQKGLLYEKSEKELKLNCKGRIMIIPLTKVMKVRLTTPKG